MKRTIKITKDNGESETIRANEDGTVSLNGKHLESKEDFEKALNFLVKSLITSFGGKIE